MDHLKHRHYLRTYLKSLLPLSSSFRSLAPTSSYMCTYFIWRKINISLLYSLIAENSRFFKKTRWWFDRLFLIFSSKLNFVKRFKFKALAAKLFNWDFHPLEVVSRLRDPQLQLSENYLNLTKLRSTNFISCWLLPRFIFNRFKSWYVMC